MKHVSRDNELSSGQMILIKRFVLPLLLIGGVYVGKNAYTGFQACKNQCSAKGAIDFRYSLAHKGKPESCTCVESPTSNSPDRTLR